MKRTFIKDSKASNNALHHLANSLDFNPPRQLLFNTSNTLHTFYTIMKNVIAAGDKITVDAARTILEAGGNAYDAAVAACFTAMVAEPALTSAGGGGFLNAFPSSEKPIVFDFFVNTPSGTIDSTKLDFGPVHVDFGITKQEFHIGPGSVGVPGIIKGLLHTQEQLGAVPIKTVLEPAIIAAKDGIVLSNKQANLLSLLEPIMGYEETSREIFFRDGELIKGGTQLIMSEFADFLDVLWREGSDLFYRGEVAKLLLETMSPGGLVTQEDLKNYEVIERKPLVTPFNGYTVLQNPPPACGGILIDFTLRLLEEAGCTSNHPVDQMHIATAFELTNDIRRRHLEGHIYEPGLVNLYDRPFFEEYLQRFQHILSLPVERYNEPTGKGSTTHISVLDKEGNAASVTTSNGSGGGVMIPKTGIMLNNMLGEEDLNPEGFHRYKPGRRISSMIAPTIVLDDGKPILVTGSAGSNRIRSAIIHVLINVLCNDMGIAEAVETPRLHFERGVLDVESGFSEIDLECLEKRYKLQQWGQKTPYFGGANSVTPDGGHGDSRRGGSNTIF